jgi:NAD(P)-dependent dehydrogenase (short-subunit alcohol dehydrogenase family)
MSKVLITGSADGLGREAAKQLARAGATKCSCMLVTRRAQQALAGSRAKKHAADPGAPPGAGGPRKTCKVPPLRTPCTNARVVGPGAYAC